MSTGGSRGQRGVCRIIGHRWVWRLSNDWPYHECLRCGSRWEVGRPVPRDFGQFKASVLAKCHPHGVAASAVWRDASLRYPEMRASDLLRVAERIVSELLDEGTV